MIRLVTGTRASRLARVQTEWIAAQIAASLPHVKITEHLIDTSGDRVRSIPAGDGMFVKELQNALLRGEIDMAVHSFKDLPTEPVAGLRVAAVPVRTDPREALAGATLASLRTGARVGTSSPRRAAQLRAARPDVVPVPIRGNVDTRLRKVRDGEYDAVLLAAAGLIRLGIEPDERIDPAIMLPAPAQGALALEIRRDDPNASAAAEAIEDPLARRCAETERAVLRALGGGCMLPVGVLAELEPEGIVRVRAGAVSPDGRRVVRVEDRVDGTEPADAGRRIANALIAAGALEVIA